MGWEEFSFSFFLFCIFSIFLVFRGFEKGLAEYGMVGSPKFAKVRIKARACFQYTIHGGASFEVHQAHFATEKSEKGSGEPQT